MCWVQINRPSDMNFIYLKLSFIISLNFVSSPQCKYMNFIYLKSSFITWMVYLGPNIDQLPAGLVGSVGRALNRYRRGHGFKSRTGLNFFRS